MKDNHHSDLTSAILTQDACLTPNGIDRERWTSTVFFPLLLMCERQTFIIQDAEAFAIHLREVEEKAQELGVARLRTDILSQTQLGENTAIVTSIRHRLSSSGDVVASTSMTWTLVLVGAEWRINQIYFNDSRFDPSVLAQMADG